MGIRAFAQQKELCGLFGKKCLVTPLALPTLAAMTPYNYDISIVDEEFEKVPFDQHFDLVGITAMSQNIGRGYQIADVFCTKGSTVIMGGSYVTYKAEEALKHCDSVVIGEAEDIWADVIRDFETSTLKRTYQAGTLTDFKTSPIPRWDLMNHKHLLSLSVQVSRGCPFRCEFCLVYKIQGNKMRYREMDDVVAEIKALPTKNVFFVDDNLTVDKRYMRELLTAIKPLNIIWNCQVSIDVAKDEEFLQEMADAGCHYMLIGLESVNPSSLKETRKYHNNLEFYRTAVERIHKVGIHIAGAFIVGFDNDEITAFDDILAFTNEMNLHFVMINILGFAPGTDIFERMKAEGRIYNDSAKAVAGMFNAAYYMNMSHAEMFEKYVQALEKAYDFENVFEKANNLFSEGNFTKVATDAISFGEKLLLVMKIIFNYSFTKKAHKRKLLFFMLKLMRTKQVSPNHFSYFLLSMEGFHRHVKYLRRNYDKFLSEIAQNDRGAYKDLRQKPQMQTP